MPTSGDTLVVAGRYELGEVLGRGGMSVVHDAHDRLLGRPVAVKLLRPELAADDDLRARFATEARCAARVGHPNAVSVYDAGDEDGRPYLVLERLPGETLAHRIAAGPVDPATLLPLTMDVLGALAAAHAQHVVHRDVKPANVLLTADGRAKVADFGIAKSVRDEEDRLDLTRTGQLVGTTAYLAPERLAGDRATAASDLWALGVVLYEALAGRKPFSGTTPIATAVAIREGVHEPLWEVRPDLPRPLTEVVERAMESDPEDRFRSAEEMAAALLAVGATDPTIAVALDHTEVFAAAPLPTSPAADRPTPPEGAPLIAAPADARPAPSAPRPRRRRPTTAERRRRLLVAAVVLVLLVGGVAAALSSGGGDGTGDPVAADTTLIGEIRQVATRVESGDGARGPEAAQRLRAIADSLEAGEDAGADATALARDATAWRREGALFRTATSLVLAVCAKVPGFDGAGLAAATTTVAAPPTTAAPVVAVRVGGDGDEAGNGNGADDRNADDGDGKPKGDKRDRDD